jgi:hypothetical protein
MPFISQQRKEEVNWNDVTSENEKNRSCIVEDPKDLDEFGMAKYYRRSRSDLKKGIKKGLENKTFTYQYER